MTSSIESAALVALLRRGKRPWYAYADLVEEAASARAVLDEEQAGQTSLFAAGDFAETIDQVERWREQGFELLTVLDATYPENLRGVHDRPPLIFVAGRLIPADARALAVIGSRAASGAGVRTATDIATHLVEAGYTVFSGLAAGVDTAAHTAALGADGRTVAVIGTGLNRCYPPQNAALQREIAARHAVVSQFWPDAPPTRRSFPMRNAVMSGMTQATVVVEASETSGARLQARLALQHGRPVFLLESLLSQDWARQFAARPGTHVVRGPVEITDIVRRLTSPDTLVG
jgi:DNA processing protein